MNYKFFRFSTKKQKEAFGVLTPEASILLSLWENIYENESAAKNTFTYYLLLK